MDDTIRSIFPEIESRKTPIAAEEALQYLDYDPQEIREFRNRGIEPPLDLIATIKQSITSILSDQQTEGWWHKLKLENFLEREEFADYGDKNGLRAAIENALRQVGHNCANLLAKEVLNVDLRELDSSDLMESARFEEQHTKLGRMAANELGVSWGQ